MKAAATGPMKGILQVSDEPLVSIDFNHDPHSSSFALPWGFSNRMSDTAVAMGKL